jgi:hypothetical protein
MTDIYGRDNEARQLLKHVGNGQSVLVIGEAGMGKSAFLTWLVPALRELGPVVCAERTGPAFGTFLKVLFEFSLDRNWCDYDDWAAFAKKYKTNDEKAKAVMATFSDHPECIIVIDDNSTVTAGNRPWLELLVEQNCVISGVEPKHLQKAGTKRYWKRFVECAIQPLNKDASAAMLDHLILKHQIVTDDAEAYRKRVLAMAQGSPYELERLARTHAGETLVKVSGISQAADSFADRDVKQVALAPLLLLGLVLLAGGRYLARARSDTDALVISGFAMVVLVILSPWIRRALKPRSS